MNDLFHFVPLPVHRDRRGTLIALEKGACLSFEPKRAFIIKDVGEHETRAQHAVSCDEFLVMLSGRCRITLRRRSGEERYPLDDQDRGLFVSAGVWMMLDQFNEKAMLLVLASACYEETEYFEGPQI